MKQGIARPIFKKVLTYWTIFVFFPI